MKPWMAWSLAAALMFTAWRAYGWPGTAMAATAIVFWLLLQFNRAIRVLKNAAGAPIGHVDSAVMLQAKLYVGMPLQRVVALARCLGRRVGESPEVWGWADGGGAELHATFVDGRCTAWELNRPSGGAE